MDCSYFQKQFQCTLIDSIVNKYHFASSVLFSSSQFFLIVKNKCLNLLIYFWFIVKFEISDTSLPN